MSLRNTLRHTTELRVARADERNTQLSDVKSATGGATASQLPTANPHECWSSSATGSATPAQLAGFEPRNTTEEQEKLRVAFASTRNTQLGGLTAHRLPAALVAAIGRCCDARGDDDHNRTGLIAESASYLPHEMADLIEHFDIEADRWVLATGQAP